MLYNNQQIDGNTIPFIVILSKLLKQMKLFLINIQKDMISKYKTLNKQLSEDVSVL